MTTMRPMNTRTHIDPPSLLLLRRASTLIAMGTVGLALIAAAPANADDAKPAKPKEPTTTTTTALPIQPGSPVYRRHEGFTPKFSEL